VEVGSIKLQVGVKVLLINAKDEILFLQRSEETAGVGARVQLDIPGGRIEPGEELTTALQREILEETGLQFTGAVELLGAQDILVPAKGLHVVRLTYRAYLAEETKIILSDEHSGYAWLGRKQALAGSLDPYIREIIETRLASLR